MAELNLSQIQTRLNELFVTFGERKLIFWFDPKKEFEEDIDNGMIKLQDAQIYKLAADEQFKTKRFFELEDRENNYLIYAPFKRMNDNDKNNHLLSILKYSTIFSADRISLIMKQLNIPSNLHPVMEKYTKFFGSKARVSAFSKLVSSEIKSKEELEMTLMAVVTKANTSQFYSVLQALFIEYANEVSDAYDQLETFDLLTVFWQYVSKYYGYSSKTPNMQKLSIVFFANTFFGQLGYQDIPSSLKEYSVSEHTTAIISFMDGVMNDSRYSVSFDKLSHVTYRLINGDKLLDATPIDELLSADIFEPIHLRIIQYYSKQLVGGDITPTVGNLTLQDIMTRQQRVHFGDKYKHHYNVILNAQGILNYALESNVNNFSTLVKYYEETSYLMDRYYRKFIWHIDQILEQNYFLELQNLIEMKYKKYLDEIGRLWNNQLDFNERPSMLDFYDNFAKNKTKTVVVISDALRYEATVELQTILQEEKKYTTEMNTIFSILPSVTEFGKAASLRSGKETFEYLQDMDVRVNNMKTNGTANRDRILKAKSSNSLAITYSDVVAKSTGKELRDEFKGKDIIYIYHDQIDRAGDHGQESQVFDAVERTIEELKELVRFVSNGANVYRFIITSDHGFIYKRSNVEEYEKIANPSYSEKDRVERRFIISQNRYDEIGVSSVKMGDVLKNKDERFIHFPETSAIFKKAGGGQNYIHGGSSPQEVIVPVLEISVSRGSSQKEPVVIQLMTPKRKIVGLSIALEFYQTESISDSVMSAVYSLYFEDHNGNRITNENTYFADSAEVSASERFTKFTFEFINRNYETNEKVYLIVKNNETHLEENRSEFVIDNPFAGGFGFDI